jgi:hypothetical protein
MMLYMLELSTWDRHKGKQPEWSLILGLSTSPSQELFATINPLENTILLSRISSDIKLVLITLW